MAAAAAAVANAVRKVGESRSVATVEEISDVGTGLMWVAAAVYPISPVDWEKFRECRVMWATKLLKVWLAVCG